jgi:hypothetical protein
MKRLIDDSIHPAARQLLEAGRNVHPDPAKKAALQAAISAGGTALLTAASPTHLGSKGAAWTVKLAKFGVLSAISGALGTAALAWYQAPGTAPQKSVAVEEAAQAPPSQVVPDEHPSSEITLPAKPEAQHDLGPAALTDEAAPRPRPAVRSARPHPSDAPSALRQEAELVASLRQAVQAGDKLQSERLSARYWRTFSNGQLAPEVRLLDAKQRGAP